MGVEAGEGMFSKRFDFNLLLLQSFLQAAMFILRMFPLNPLFVQVRYHGDNDDSNDIEKESPEKPPNYIPSLVISDGTRDRPWDGVPKYQNQISSHGSLFLRLVPR